MPPTTLFGLGYGTGPAGYGYPPGARRPSISYPDSPFTWYDHVEITASLPTNGGGPITNYSVLSGSLPAGVSLNATTGELTGTPTTQQSAASVVIRARGPGGVSDTTISVEVLAMPLSLGSSLAAWYKADAGCYTDAACLFASASSQYLSKTSPTFAPTTKMTIRASYNQSATAAHSIACRWGGSQDQFILSVQGTGIVRFLVAEGLSSDGSHYVDGSTVLSDNTPYEIVVVYDGTLAAGSRVAIYVNGVAETLTINSAIPAALTVSTAPLEIGYVANVWHMDGTICRLGFSSLALSGAALTAAHTSTFWADMTAARQADWFSFYNLCEKDNTRVDSTGLNNLTPTNGPTVAAGPGEGLCVNNSPCKRVTDYSGNSRNLLQATVSAQPIWLASGQNGLPVLRFTSANSTTIKATYTLAQPADIFAAFAWTGQDYALDGGSLHAMALLTNGGNAQMYAGSFGPALTSPSTEFHVFRMLFSGASSVFSIDSGADATGNPGTATTAGLTVGSSGTPGNYSSLDFGELFIASAAVGASSQPKAYLKQRWNTP